MLYRCCSTGVFGKLFNLKHELQCSVHHLCFVPRHESCSPKSLVQLQNFVNMSSKLFVLTGAGISTESGIPDYRSEGVGLYATSTRRPVLIRDFLASYAVRRRYWARNYSGWPRFSSVSPNSAHLSLSNWESAGRVGFLVTQNVDRLHIKAGSSADNTVELHGSAYKIVCLSCAAETSRDEFQQIMKELNPDMPVAFSNDQDKLQCKKTSGGMRPDGDVDLTDEHMAMFRVPKCHRCHNGILKPDIVFFGENVPRQRVDHVYDGLASCDAVLVAGSSLFVYSGYRFVSRAGEMGLPVAIVNIGETRGDWLATVKVNARCGEVLSRLLVEREC